MTYPNEFTPSDTITVPLPSGAAIDLPVVNLILKPWLGKLPDFSFGNKPFVDYKGEGIFAELAILKMFTNSGWNGTWVETYGGIHFLNEMPIGWKTSKHNISIPSDKEKILRDIWKAGKTTACFDVFLWKDNEILFCEGKHKGKDRLTNAQTKFIESVLAYGISPKSLIIVEWDYKSRQTSNASSSSSRPVSSLSS